MKNFLLLLLLLVYFDDFIDTRFCGFGKMKKLRKIFVYSTKRNEEEFIGKIDFSVKVFLLLASSKTFKLSKKI